MKEISVWWWLGLALFCLVQAVLVFLLLGNRRATGSLLNTMGSQIEGKLEQVNERTERELRGAIQTSASTYDSRIEQLRATLTVDARANREEASIGLNRFGDGMQQQLRQLTQANEAKLTEVRATLESKLKDLQTENMAKLEEMRRTVDEKLHATLEQRLGESFKLVSDRLEQVHRGLGEMQNLATGVGDLKRVLTNVKTRGTWGEVQLAALLEQMLLPEQYAANVATIPGSKERVEFAIQLPGVSEDQPVWLPIDAKFPREDYERLLQAQEDANAQAAEDAGKMLEQRIKLEAKTIKEKYISVPYTTDFGILFLATEGLYAEVIKRPGLADEVQRVHRVMLSGPSTLGALLNSLQMGFRTLAIEKRSSEVWLLLGAVKTEFLKFGDVLAKTKRQLETVSNSLGDAETRTRQIERKLRGVEQLPDAASKQLLGMDESQDPEKDTSG